jgi:hypothetical protein
MPRDEEFEETTDLFFKLDTSGCKAPRTAVEIHFEDQVAQVSHTMSEVVFWCNKRLIRRFYLLRNTRIYTILLVLGPIG